MNSSEASLLAVLEGRRDTYQLLSRLFRREVDEELLAALLATRYPADSGDAHIDHAYRLIVTYLSHAGSDVLTQLAIDYAHTFIGSGSDTYAAAYPFESVYTSPKRLMMQEARDEVLLLYRAAGLEKLESEKEAEDHLALELQFMEILVERSMDALQEGNQEEMKQLLCQQRNFLEDHLLFWYPMMENDIQRLAKTGFYKGVGELALGFIEVDAAFLDELLDGPEVETAGHDGQEES